MEPEQYEVQRILDASPEVAGEPAITDEIELARQALMERVRRRLGTEALLSGHSPPERLYIPRRYALAELLKPPLTTFGPPGAEHLYLDFGEWEELDRDVLSDIDTAREALAKGELDWEWIMWGTWAPEALATVRLGDFFRVWRLLVLGKPVEYIEHWGARFDRPEEEEHDRYREAECYYRYSFDDPQHGLVYVGIVEALRGEGGVPLSAALADGLAHGLLLPESDLENGDGRL